MQSSGVFHDEKRTLGKDQQPLAATSSVAEYQTKQEASSHRESMKPDTLQLLQASFLRLASDRTSSSRLFYDRLFELSPGLRCLFKVDLIAQQQKLMTSLVQIMRSVEQPAALAASIDGLAQRHLAYGARPEHLETFNQALLWTLEKQLGADFTDEMREAWQDTYAKVARLMTDAMLVLLRDSAASASIRS
jgi:hemoglobin-like flavoprotein